MSETTTLNRERIGLVIGPVGRLNTRVVRFLLLNLNTLQNSLEFEFVPSPPGNKLIALLAGRGSVDRQTARSMLSEFAQDCAANWKALARRYDLPEDMPPRLIVLSTSRFADNYYTTSSQGVGIIALGNWKRIMAPPSLVEFFFFITLRMAIGLVDSRIWNAVHLGTKGCLWDFTASLDDVRYKILVGLVCPTCQQTLRSGPLAKLADALPMILGKQWLGKREDPLSPAATCAKLGYDLFLSKGPRATLGETLLAVAQQETTKEAIKWIFALLLAYVLVLTKLKKP